MSQPRDFGLPGVELAAGDHLCAMYLGQQERDAIVVPYIRTGLAAGDKCICIIDSLPIGELQERIGDPKDVKRYIASLQLELFTADQAYLRTLPFSAEAMLDFWESRVGPAITSGTYSFARGAGEMPWELATVPSRAEFFRYEAAVNEFVPRYPQAYLCLYDLALFGGGFIVDLLRTHPKLLMGGLVLENPHYRSPADLANVPG